MRMVASCVRRGAPHIKKVVDPGLNRDVAVKSPSPAWRGGSRSQPNGKAAGSGGLASEEKKVRMGSHRNPIWLLWKEPQLAGKRVSFDARSAERRI